MLLFLGDLGGRLLGQLVERDVEPVLADGVSGSPTVAARTPRMFVVGTDWVRDGGESDLDRPFDPSMPLISAPSMAAAIPGGEYFDDEPIRRMVTESDTPKTSGDWH
ncbi:hypothetical protein OTB20_25300 [Streptomyces sp. H27-H1]|uniref:hypothetical protein n=1 Tax=unclassified Streptomyces TaxID=2593676 RepID=UPI00226EE073|nr:MULTISPECIES: hypothetical protein [unclassified Streptomyces]MCY0929456.1 hypothetical protein [Streptomyces sp. H27-H1]MCY0938328.1 hypothetical protein [Streptomyces sp. H34-S4]